MLKLDIIYYYNDINKLLEVKLRNQKMINLKQMIESQKNKNNNKIILDIHSNFYVTIVEFKLIFIKSLY